MFLIKDFTIGVLGGMGTFATIHLFQQYAKVFPAEKEWDRPRIVIDNRCTMPSRVRAYLYKERVEQLIDEMADSMQHLADTGCNRILLACNTSHLFLPQIYEKSPELEEKVIHLIETCVDKVKEDGVEEIYLLGSEGTIDSGIYQKALEQEGIKCVVPLTEEYESIRKCIEAVKQDEYTDDVKKIFLRLLEKYDVYILGCTELPILYEMYRLEITKKRIYDPLLLGLEKLKEEYANIQDSDLRGL